MSKRECPQIEGYISALYVEEQAVDIMPGLNSGGQLIRLYANNALWGKLVHVAYMRWISRRHVQGTFYRHGRVLLDFSIWSWKCDIKGNNNRQT
jgi:hypothetical protein